MNNVTTTKSVERYVPQYKQKVLDFLKSNDSSKVTIVEASKRFKVHPVTISDWVKDVERQNEIKTLEAKHDIISPSGSGECSLEVTSELPSVYEKVESDILQWLCSKRVEQVDLQSHEIANKIQTVVQDVCQEYIRDGFQNKSKFASLLLWSQKMKQQRDSSTQGVQIMDTPELQAFQVTGELKLNCRLQEELDEVRRKRLLEDNIEEDRNIRQLEKKLKIRKKKKKEKLVKKPKEESYKKSKKEPKEDIWEDIYGRLRGTDGGVIDEKSLTTETESTGKYVPSGRRGNQSAREKILKTIKGQLNRLAESNIHGISQQVEELYMTNSRNEMNETLMEQYCLSLISPVTMSERIILEHVMLITILHANVGSEIGAFFIQNSVQKFRKLYDETPNLEETKELCNLTLLISSMYHFKIIGCGLIFDILNFLAGSFKAKDIELILVILKSVGFRLRKDDPISLKNLVLLLQRQATSSSETDSRVKFMLDILLAIKNNNMTKIPNYDPTFGEHLLKMLKQHFHKGSYVVELKVSMEDLLNADTKGRWWVVGSAWTNDKDPAQSIDSKESNTMASVSSKVKAKLLAKAKQFGMNTDTRKNIFCIIMTAEDYLDAFEKLMHLGLRNQQEREIIHVIVYCCLHENKYNPFYALILCKLCAVDRRFMLTLQYNIWDRLKDLPSLSSKRLQNMSSLLADLINEKSLPLSILKVVEFGDMKKENLTLLKHTLSGVLLQQSIENLQDIFTKVALSEKLYVFRESLRLFMGHFMLKSSVTVEGGEEVTSTLDAKTLQLLEDRMKLADRAMDLGRGRVQL